MSAIKEQTPAPDWTSREITGFLYQPLLYFALMLHRFLFVDVHILLHYTFFDEINWTDLADANTIQLVLPYTVISILDEKKYSSSDSAVKERARNVIAKLEEISDRKDAQVRASVTLCLLSQELEINYSQWGLNRQSEDDRLIADILFFRQQHPSEDSALVTADLGLKLKCKQHGIPLVQLPDRYVLPDRSDAQDKRTKELEAALLEIQNLQPKLSLLFPSGKNYTEVNLTLPQMLSDQAIREQVEERGQILKRQQNNTPRSSRLTIRAL